MAYANYTFYKDVFKGRKLSASEFDYYAERAADYLDSLPGGSLAVDEVKVKKACCAVAEACRLNEQGGRIVQEAVSGYSRTMEASAQTQTDVQRLLAAAKPYINSGGWV